MVLGLLISFIGCVPMTGPNAAIIIQRLIDRQANSAALIAAGAAVAEVFYAALIAIPLPYALSRYQQLVPISRIAGGLAVGAVGLLLLLRPKVFESPRGASPSASFATGFAMAAFNPTLFATWTAVTATLYTNHLLATTTGAALAFALGVGLGVMCWFGAIALLFPLVARHLGGARQVWLMRGLGLVMLVGAVWLLLHQPAG